MDRLHPQSPELPLPADYSRSGLPWFDYYAADLESLAGVWALTLAKSVAELAAEKGQQVLGPDGDVTPAPLIALGPGKSPCAKMRRVREGET